MQLYIDDKPTSKEASSGASLDEVLQGIRDDNSSSQRAILSVACDGIDLASQNVESMLQAPADSFERIEVQTGDPSRMIADALDDALDLLDVVEKERIEIISHCASGKTGQAMTLLAECVGRWHQVNSTIIQSLALITRSSSDDGTEVSRLAERLQPIQAKLADVRNAIVQRDFVMLSDILEYEFADVSTCWREVINTIQDNMRRPAQSAGS